MLLVDASYASKVNTNSVRAAVGAKVSRQRNSSAKTEQNAQSIHDHVNDRDSELVNERCREEVQQCEQPPYSNEQGVVDD